MEDLDIAANVIAVIDLSAKVADWCVEYCKAVKNAKDDIVRLRLEVVGLQSAANAVKDLLIGPNGERLKASQQLCNSVRHSESELQAVYERLRPRSAREIFARLGLPTLTWPFKSKEVEKIVQNIVRCTQVINLALQVDQTNILSDLDRRAVLARLETEVAKGASFDSRAQEHHPTCLRKTRVDLLQQVSMWAHDPSAETVFWLDGMAGTGKSTIARTVARDLAHNNRLGASFFFKRGETDRTSMSKVFPTIAADLVKNIPTIAPHVKDAIETDPGILRKTACEQFGKLVWQPLSMIASDSSSPIPVVVLDALDECEREEDIKLMFRLLSRAGTGQSVRLKVFLTSRPELPIRLGFKGMDGEYQNLRLQEISQHVITHDITTFFHEELRRIRREYNSTVREERQLPDEWPGASELINLVDMAIPLFIFATTVCRFIGDRRLGSPDRQLAKVLLRTSVEGSQLAATYLPVLENMVHGNTLSQGEETVRAFRIIVGAIVVLASPLSVPALAKILNISKQDVEDKLDMLHSVLSVPEAAEAPVRLLHLSFRDFLVDAGQRAAHPFWIDEKQTHQGMAAHCLRVLECLRQDMCDIKAPGTLRSAVDQRRIGTFIPPEVQYACLYWVYHLRNGGTPARHCDQVMSFLERHFLHWIESLSLIGRSRETAHLVGALQLLYKDDGPIQLSEWLDDAMRFVQAYSFAIENTPLQIYSSLLFFSPKRSIVRTTFSPLIPQWISLQPKVDECWSRCLQTLEGHAGVRSVTFSHDSALVASSSDDGLIRIWRTATGECVQIMKIHSSAATSVAFSRDSMHVASGSWDNMVRLWRVDTGECVQAFEGHGSVVSSVAFSHDSTLIASGSEDKTIRLWLVAMGVCVQTLEGHGSSVTSVSFSHDSALVASGCYDRTIRMWRTATGECIQTLEGHGSSVTSVSFSHDSALVASGCYNGTIRMWRTATGECIQTLESHGDSTTSVFSLSHDWVTSLSFSHDSAFVASGSRDKMVRLWRVDTGECEQAFEGHGGVVSSVAFSHDSTLIASGSWDDTIRLWRVSASECSQTLEDHDDRVRSVVFSHDSAFVASGSNDMTILVWNTVTGECVQTLEGHEDAVTSVAFSHDSALIASGSDDTTIRVWDTTTGECVLTLEGHEDFVYSVAFSHDSALIASGSGSIRIWRTATGECVQELKCCNTPVSQVFSVAFSHDSALVASGSKTIRLWNVATGECLQTFEGHKQSSVRAVAFSSDSALVASASYATIQLWRMATGERVQTLDVGFATSHLAFEYSNSQLLTDRGAIATRLNTPECSPTDTLGNGTPAIYSLLGVSEDGFWITWNGKNLFWLPKDYRPSACAVSGSTVAIGTEIGRVVVIALSHRAFLENLTDPGD